MHELIKEKVSEGSGEEEENARSSPIRESERERRSLQIN